jgi:hypothetical protein
MLALFSTSAAPTRAACPAVHQAAATYCNTMHSTASASSTAHRTRTLSRRAGSQCLVPPHAAGSPAITLSQRRLWHSAITHARRARSQLAQGGRRRRPPPPQPQRVGSGASNPLIPNDNPAVRPRRSNLSAAAGDAGPMASHDRNSPGRRVRPSDSAHSVPSPVRTPSRPRLCCRSHILSMYASHSGQQPFSDSITCHMATAHPLYDTAANKACVRHLQPAAANAECGRKR